MHRAFGSYGTIGSGPVVVSVPHTGRAYPAGIEDMLAVPLDRAYALEDAYADRLAQGLIAAGHSVLIAHAPRLLIDLNRAETDFAGDVSSESATDVRREGRPSARARAGLGIIPTRLGNERLWRQPPSRSALSDRLLNIHRPYHQALNAALAAARQRFGVALLVDLHSMPPLIGPEPPQVVLGDRHGRSANGALLAAARTLLASHGIRSALNEPYAGGYILERHSDPSGQIFGLQIEIDRRRYLDAALQAPGPGLASASAMIAALIAALERALPINRAVAAE